MTHDVVRRILESAGHLKSLLDRGETVSLRELQDLREAFERHHRQTEHYEFSKKAIQCETLLAHLEQRIRGNDESLTGDSPFSPDTQDGAPKESWKFLNIPIRRRTQTLVVSAFLFFTGLPVCILLTLLLFMHWFTLPVMVSYVMYIALSRLKHPLPVKSWYINSPFWKHYRDYFPIRLVIPKNVRSKINRRKNYMFVYHPHGVHSFGAMVNFGSNANGIHTLLPGITIHCQTLRMNFWIPFWRHIFTFGGCGDASAGCIMKTLSAGGGESVLLVVGGAEESLLSKPGTNDLTLGKRKGFVKLALRAGAPLVPIYGFGENNVYCNLAEGKPKVQRVLKWLQKKIGFAPVLIHGRGWFNYNFGILPHRRPIVVVVGEPIEVPRIDQPTQEEVDKWHAVYVEALKKLYQENNNVYDLKGSGLRIVG